MSQGNSSTKAAKGKSHPDLSPTVGERHQGKTAEQQDTCFPTLPHFYNDLCIFLTRKAAPLSEESGFCLPCKVHPLFKANSSVQHKQGPLKTFSSKTIATTFDVFVVLALPHCLIIMFYNIFSPSLPAPFQVPQLWNSWLHHPKLLHSVGHNGKNSVGFILTGRAAPRACVLNLSRAPDVPVAGLEELSSRESSPSSPGIPPRALLPSPLPWHCTRNAEHFAGIAGNEPSGSGQGQDVLDPALLNDSCS